MITGFINFLVDLGNSFRSLRILSSPEFNEGIKEASAAELEEQFADLKEEALGLSAELGTFLFDPLSVILWQRGGGRGRTEQRNG